jgi:hypothetical protein
VELLIQRGAAIHERATSNPGQSVGTENRACGCTRCSATAVLTSRKRDWGVVPALFLKFAFFWRVRRALEFDAVAVRIGEWHYPQAIANRRTAPSLYSA